MGRIVSLATAQAMAAFDPGGQETYWLYNALDTTGTREIWDNLHPRLTPNQARTYAFERGLQAPALSMMRRAVRVNEYKRNEMTKELRKEITRDERILAKLPQVVSVWDVLENDTGNCTLAPARSDGTPGKHSWPRGVEPQHSFCKRCGTTRQKLKVFNPGSVPQKMHLFYDLHHVSPMTNKTGKVSTDGDVLDRIGRLRTDLRPLTDAINGLQDKNKQLGSLSARLTPDGRYPSSFNIGAAWTGRQSSSKNPFGLGGNLQNWAPRHRGVAEADHDKDMGYADYMQGESNIVAHLSGDERYLEAHLGGDVHTYVTRYVWPDMPWTGDLAKDKKIAKQLPEWDPVEGHDFRFQCKRIQHGSNYGLTPQGISMIAHIPLLQAKRAYANYMDEFEGIPLWHKDTRRRVEEHETIVNPLGREWTPFGRPWDKRTFRQALAFLPQSLLADVDNIAMWRVWYYLEEHGVELLAQVHDALLHQYPVGRLDLERGLLQLMKIPVPITDIHGKTRIMTIGVESATGKNWGHHSADNPRGIAEAAVADYLKDHPLI